jgi:hypothetical protein
VRPRRQRAWVPGPSTSPLGEYIVTRRGQLVLKIAVGVAFAFAAWCALWVFSSADLAFVPCHGNYSLFAPTFRCRQPPLAMVLCGASLLVAFGLILIGRIAKRSSTRHPDVSA